MTPDDWTPPDYAPPPTAAGPEYPITDLRALHDRLRQQPPDARADIAAADLITLLAAIDQLQQYVALLIARLHDAAD